MRIEKRRTRKKQKKNTLWQKVRGKRTWTWRGKLDQTLKHCKNNSWFIPMGLIVFSINIHLATFCNCTLSRSPLLSDMRSWKMALHLKPLGEESWKSLKCIAKGDLSSFVIMLVKYYPIILLNSLLALPIVWIMESVRYFSSSLQTEWKISNSVWLALVFTPKKNSNRQKINED